MNSLFSPNQRVAVAVCTPCPKRILPNGEAVLDTISMQWHRCRMGLDFSTNINMMELFADGMEVGDARTGVAHRCLEHVPTPEFLFFLDWDVLCNYDSFTKLFFRARCYPDHDIFAGVYTLRGHNPPEPLIYTGDGAGPFWDWTVGDILTTKQHGISSVHMGLTLIRVSLFQRMLDAGVVDKDTPFFKTIRSVDTYNGRPVTRHGSEDIWFCNLARNPKVNAQIMVDTSVLAGHYDKDTGVTWGLPEYTPPCERARWLSARDRKEADEYVEEVLCEHCSGRGRRHSEAPDCEFCLGTGKQKVKKPFKLALDIGAGGTRRQWPNHKTYTTDIRADTKPDYVQDTLKLNLPSNHFDLIASSHHLEHIGRWDQETVWKEIYRICKPGGYIEHIVPTIEWAAHKIIDGQTDEHVLNVLYGAQEAHGYERQFNLHYFGYTKAIAKALAEDVGFVDVQVIDWKDDEKLGYNLVITGRKPEDSTSPQEAVPARLVQKALISSCATTAMHAKSLVPSVTPPDLPLGEIAKGKQLVNGTQDPWNAWADGQLALESVRK